MPAIVAVTTGENFSDRRCPKCGAYDAMTNPHIAGGGRLLPEFRCNDCGTQFDAGQDTE